MFFFGYILLNRVLSKKLKRTNETPCIYHILYVAFPIHHIQKTNPKAEKLQHIYFQFQVDSFPDASPMYFFENLIVCPGAMSAGWMLCSWIRWSRGRPPLISALLSENEQDGALGQKNIVILVGVLNDLRSVSVLVVACLRASNSLFSWVSACLGIFSLLTFE